jgi:hypothetical protein
MGKDKTQKESLKSNYIICNINDDFVFKVFFRWLFHNVPEDIKIVIGFFLPSPLSCSLAPLRHRLNEIWAKKAIHVKPGNHHPKKVYRA